VAHNEEGDHDDREAYGSADSALVGDAHLFDRQHNL
jgi:hypothetical protein